MAAQLGLRNAALASATSAVVSSYVHGKNSYRERLSEAARADRVIEVKKNTSDDGNTGNPSEVDVRIYSKKEYDAEKDPKKKKTAGFIRIYSPEIIHRWSNLETIGQPHSITPNGPVNRHKRKINLQSYFPEDIDDELNKSMQKLKRQNKIAPYEDINEEIRFFFQGLFDLEQDVLRELFASPDCSPALKVPQFTAATELIAARRGVEPHELDDTDPEVYEHAYQSWCSLPQIHHSIVIDERHSEPDTCVMGEKCPGRKCRNKGHVRGKWHFILKLQDYIFSKKDRNATLPNFGAEDLATEWTNLNKEAALVMTPEEKREEIDLFAQEKLLKAGYQFNPVYYKTKRTLNQSYKIAEKQGIKAGYFDRMHPKQLGYGNVLRVSFTLRASSHIVEQGIGLRFFLNAKDVVIVNGKCVACDFDEADDIATFGEEDIDFTKTLAEREMRSAPSSSLYNTPANAASAAVPANADETSPADLKRKLDENETQQGSEKRVKREQSPDVSEEEEDEGEDEPMDD